MRKSSPSDGPSTSVTQQVIHLNSASDKQKKVFELVMRLGGYKGNGIFCSLCDHNFLVQGRVITLWSGQDKCVAAVCGTSCCVQWNFRDRTWVLYSCWFDLWLMYSMALRETLPLTALTLRKWKQASLCEIQGVSNNTRKPLHKVRSK